MSSRPSRPSTGSVRTRKTARGWRITQNGTVLSEVLAHPGPTHSVFDVLAAAALLRGDPVRTALLGFGGGSVVAALRSLESFTAVHAVDLDTTGVDLLQTRGCPWLQPFHWHHGDAVQWLASQGRFDVIIEDLSVPTPADVMKPDATWSTLPARVARHLAPSGLAIFNLLRPGSARWETGIGQVIAPFPEARCIVLDDFENRIVLAGRGLPSARALGTQLRALLTRLGSRQATRIKVRSL